MHWAFEILGGWAENFRDLRKVASHTHPSTMSYRALEHYCAMAAALGRARCPVRL